MFDSNKSDTSLGLGSVEGKSFTEIFEEYIQYSEAIRFNTHHSNAHDEMDSEPTYFVIYFYNGYSLRYAVRSAKGFGTMTVTIHDSTGKEVARQEMVE